MSAPLPTAIFGAWSCTVRLVVADQRVLDVATADLVNLLGRVDAAVSRFRADSELTTANNRAGRPTPVSRLTVDLVGAALAAAKQTGGAVDPTVGLAMVANGYDRDIAAVIEAPGAARPTAPQRATWRDVRLDRTTGLLSVPPGSALDLGATAKAFTADLAARTIFTRYGSPVLVELGGDLAVAGSPPAGWAIHVAEAPGPDGQVVTITRGGLTTSTTTVRRWQRGSAQLHHIVDPATGAPAQGPWRTVSVWAESAFAANTASTAAIVLGSAALPWLEANAVTARLVDHAGGITRTGAWPLETTSTRKAA